MQTVTKVVDDKILIEEILKGDHKAFETLIQRYQRQVANLIYMTMGNTEDVEDIAQEVFIRVYKSLPKFKHDASLYSWIHRITMNLCIDEIRKKKVRRILSLDFLTEDMLEKSKKSKEHLTPSDTVINEEGKNLVQEALRKISPEHREVLVLREYQNYSYTEIGDALGLSIEAVKSRIFRARKELRNLLSEYFEERT